MRDLQNQYAVKYRFQYLILFVLSLVAACSPGDNTNSTSADPDNSQVDVVEIDRSLSARDIDPAIYFQFDDPNDPFGEVYAQFRERRSRDMADTSKPSAIEAFAPVHLTRDMPWSSLEDVFLFDWSNIRASFPEEVLQLEKAVKVRLALDHPDIKIVQLMIAPGAIMPEHAGGSPGFYHVIDGTGEITVEGKTQTVSPGTTVKLSPYDVRRVHAVSEQPLKILWIRWAPDGDQSYMAAGYYLTGANQHIQPKEGVLPADYHFWGSVLSTEPLDQPTASPAAANTYSSGQSDLLKTAREELGEGRNPYPDAPAFSHESSSKWFTKDMKGNFFWLEDLGSKTLAPLMDRWVEVMRYKALFQASRPGGGWDFNISQMVWGPHSRYVEHSHSIPEFYYMLSGPVEHWVDGQKYRAMPGDIFLTNSYVPHESRGIVDDMPFRNIGASWAPNGNREVFRRPFFLLEKMPSQPEHARIEEDQSFH